MDHNPILFVFMILFLTFLTNYSTALEYDPSSLTEEVPWRRGSRYSMLEKMHHKLRRSKKSKLYKTTNSDSNENLSPRNMETFVTENTEETPKRFTGSVYEDKVTEVVRSLAKESDPKSIRRDSRDYFNDSSDTVTIEQFTTDMTNNGEETSTPKPRKRSRKSKRKMKKNKNKNKNKKYKPQFKITKIKSKKRNKGRKIQADMPDIVEAILNQSQEMYLETLPALPTKHTKFFKSTKEKRRKSKKNKKHSNHIGDSYEGSHNKGGGWQKLTYRKKKAGKTKHQKKKHHKIPTTTVNTEDYLETVNSEEVEDSTKRMHKINHESAEIIYVTPRYKKYKPEFRYIRIDSEPLIYGNLHTRDSEMARSPESDNSKSESKETEEPDSIQKDVTIWAESFRYGNSREESNDEDDESETTETSERSSKETDESDHDHDSLKIRRTADEKWFDLGGEKVKYPYKMKDNYRVKKSTAVNDNPLKIKIVQYKNYHQKKSNEDVAGRKDQIVNSNHAIIKQQHKTVTPNHDIEEQQDITVSPIHNTGLMTTSKKKMLSSILRDRLAPVIEYGMNKNNTGQEKKPAKRFTPSDDILMITFEEDQTSRYEPSVNYKSHYRRLRKKLFGKKSKSRTTRNIMRLPKFTDVMAVHRRVMEEHSHQIEEIHKEIIDNSTINDSADAEPESTEVFTEKPKWRYEPVIEFVPRKNSFLGQTQDDEETREIQDPLVEKYETHFDESKHYDNSPEQTHVKRSTLHEKVKVVKISHGRTQVRKKKRKNFMTTNQPEETTSVDDYLDTNTDVVKETEKTPNRYSNTYQVHENVIDIPDNRHIPGPILPNYMVTSNHKLTILPNMTNKLGDFNPYNGPAEVENTEHPIVNIVHSMKDYFTVIGKGLFNTVKDIFKEQTRRRRALESQEDYFVKYANY